MTDKELNENLALKVGFIKIAPRDEDDSTYYGDNKGYFEQDPPSFTEDFNACLRWIMPVLRERGIFEVEFAFCDESVLCHLTHIDSIKIPRASAEDETLPLAFCRAALMFLGDK